MLEVAKVHICCLVHSHFTKIGGVWDGPGHRNPYWEIMYIINLKRESRRRGNGKPKSSYLLEEEYQEVDELMDHQEQ